ncbi:MAG: S9 family peptidase [Planctomycetota bacterium]
MFRLALLVAVCFVLPVQAQTRPMAFEDLWKLERVGKPAISPDGAWVVVEAAQFDLDADSSTSNLWLLSTDGKRQKQLTNTKGKNSGPAWSYDGKTIAFVSKRSGDVPQIYLISPEGGEARPLTDLPMAPSGLKWSRDSKNIFCIVNTWPGVAGDEEFRKREKERKESKSQAFVIDDAMFRVWDTWIADGKRPVVFRVNVDTGKHENLFAKTTLSLAPFFSDAGSYDVAPDGKTIAFSAETTKEIGTDFNADIYEMPIAPLGEPKNLTTDNHANDTSPAYSADGDWLIFLRQTIKYFYADRSRLMALDRRSGKTAEVLPKLDRSVVSFALGMASPVDIWFDFEDKGYHRISMATPTGDGKLTQIPSKYSDTAPAVASKSAAVAFLRSSFDFPAQVWVAAKDEVRRIDRFNDAVTKQWDLGEVKNVTFKGAGDADVQMWIIYPPKFDPKKKWPLIQFVHGGPHNGITTDFSYRWNAHLMASKGYVVSIINFHGSSGFGQEFTDSIKGDMATKPFIDVMKGTDYMENLPYIDKNRMAAVGASYGGYMMAWINGHSDRFKAMVCHAGVYNWHSMMASDFVRSRERSIGAMPWGDLTLIDKQSPQRFAKDFKTPTLVTHGEKDFRVPLGQGLEYYNTLRLKGVPTRFVYFPDENHWILKAQNSRVWTREFFAWIDRYIGHGPTP